MDTDGLPLFRGQDGASAGDDPAEVAAARDAAIDRVEQGAPEGWLRLARAVLCKVAGYKQHLTTEDLWQELPPPPEPRAMGAVMREARKAGWIEPTDQYRPGTRAKSHGRPVRVWRSNLFGRGWRERA